MSRLCARVKPPTGAVLAAAVVLIVARSVLQASAQGVVPEPQMRSPSPAFTVHTTRGDISVESLRGKVVLLDFMTTTCPACRQASHGIQKVYSELGFRGFQPLGVALNVTSSLELFPYAMAQGLTFELGTAPRTAILEYLQHRADRPLLVPTLVLLDRHGRTCSVEVGWQGEAALRANVLRLLSEPDTQD